MNPLHLYRRRLVLMLAILGLLVLGSPITHAAGHAQVPPVASPLLIKVSAAQSPGSVLVTGQSFTPGGDVYIALYDQWGMQLYETRWVNASVTVYGPNGSQDPANGFSHGGTINEIFGVSQAIYGPNGSQDPANGYLQGSAANNIVGSLCGTAAMTRAYDMQTATWSNMLDVDAGC